MDKILQAKKLIEEADAIVIGAGAGLSAAAGLTYSGERFEKNFKEFIAEYKMTDMYSAGFYPFKTSEEKWGFWSKQILVNRYTDEGIELHRDLYNIVKDKDYFVLTTNVDSKVEMSGFDKSKIFEVQGKEISENFNVLCHVITKFIITKTKC